MDGHKQRQALTAAEQALRALIAGDAVKARQATTRAVELDQAGVFREAGRLLAAAADSLDATGRVTPEQWQAISGSLGPGPLAVLADRQSAAEA